MGEAAARKEIAARLRREIGDKAAAAVGELREFLDQTNKNHRALASGLAQAELRIDKSLTRGSELADQVDAVRLRLGEVTAAATAGADRTYNGLNGRLEVLENAHAERSVSRDSLFFAALLQAETRLFDEKVALGHGPFAWLPWRRRRVQDLANLQQLVAGLYLALGIAYPSQRLAALPTIPPGVVE